MFTSMRKIKKAKDAKPDAFEKLVAQALFDLEVNDAETRAELQFLHIRGARNIHVSKEKQAIVLFVPTRQLSDWRKIQKKVVAELEKKFSGKHVIIVGDRKSRKRYQSSKHRPIARTRKVVEENLMNDVCHPVDIVGKRMRVKLDGSTYYRVFLDPKEKDSFQSKTKSFAVVYKKLTGKNTKFEFSPY